jgi:hypothetical protein
MSEMARAINWRTLDEIQPSEGQLCLTKMKHGFISGYYDAQSISFTGYYWGDMEWFADFWVPVSEIAPPKEQSGNE